MVSTRMQVNGYDIDGFEKHDLDHASTVLDFGPDSYKDKELEKLLHEIRTEYPSFNRRMIPRDLLQPVIVRPYRLNNRMIKPMAQVFIQCQKCYFAFCQK